MLMLCVVVMTEKLWKIKASTIRTPDEVADVIATAAAAASVARMSITAMRRNRQRQAETTAGRRLFVGLLEILSEF